MLDAAANPGGILSIIGRGVSAGVTINDASGDIVAVYHPTPIRVSGGQLDLLGVVSTPGNAMGSGVSIASRGGAPAMPSLDLSQASHARIHSQGAMGITNVAIAGSGNVADLAVVNATVYGGAGSGLGMLNLSGVTLTSAAGSNTSFEGALVTVDRSTLNTGNLAIVSHVLIAGDESIRITLSSANSSRDLFIGGASSGGRPAISMFGSQLAANAQITVQGGGAVTIADSSVESRASSVRVQGSMVGSQGSSVSLQEKHSADRQQHQRHWLRHHCAA